jgi:hypothetical protein
MDGTSESYVDNQSDSYSETHSRGTHRSKSIQDSRAHGRAEGTQEVRNINVTGGVSRSTATTPFYEYDKEYRVSSRTFESEPEYLTTKLQKMMSLPRGHVFLKVPGKAGRFLRLPWVSTPWISEKTRTAGLERVYSLPFYSRPGDSAAERLLEDSVVSPIKSDRLIPVTASVDMLISERSAVLLVPENDDEDFAGPEGTFKPKKAGKKK